MTGRAGARSRVMDGGSTITSGLSRVCGSQMFLNSANASSSAGEYILASSAPRARPSPYARVPVYIDAGDDDPFQPGITAFKAALRDADAPLTVSGGPGGHDLAYWDRHWAGYFRFYARALRR